MELEKRLQELLGLDELNLKVDEKIASFNGLITREVAIKIIAKEQGIIKDKEQKIMISELKPGMRNISITGIVTKIYQEVRYISGKISRSIVISDGSGEVLLKLWEEDTKKVKTIGMKDKVIIKGANERRGELNLGYKGEIQIVENAPWNDLDKLPIEGQIKTRGIVKNVEGIKKHFNKEVFSFTISDQEGITEIECLILDKIKRGEKIEQGDEVILEDIVFQKGKLNIPDKGRILVKKNKGFVRGIIKEMDSNEDKLHLKVDDHEFVLDRQKALQVLEVKAKEDISLSTIVKLKKDSMINTFITIQKDE